MHTFIQLAYGPLIYLYILKTRDAAFLPATRWYLFLPLMIASIFYLSAVNVLIWSPALGHRLLDIYNRLSFFLILAVHGVFSYLALIACRINTASKKETHLATGLSGALILIGISEIVLVIAGNYNPAYNTLVRSILYSIIGTMPFLIIRYKYEGIHGEPINDPDQGPEILSQEDEKKLLLSPGRHKEIFQSIEDFFQNSKAYKEEDFSLDKLASSIGISRYYISETLNKYARKPFYQYLNEYRIREAISRIEYCIGKEIHFNILMIAHDSGFKAKSSFNQHFKKITGETPSAFVRNRVKSPSPY
ncbi:MAG TPA: helix-turn-helix domain-containing protein [Puia sp.]|nr:helix-turn-helix domain-containing protein [Puia sp.]